MASLLARRSSSVLIRRALHGGSAGSSNLFQRSQQRLEALISFKSVDGYFRIPPVRGPSPVASGSNRFHKIPFAYSHGLRFLSTSANPPPDEKLQEAEETCAEEVQEPTLERDTSSLAEELRMELSRLRQTIYLLSKSMALLAFTHLSCGVFIQWAFKPSNFSEISCQSIFAFAFPFVMAFTLRSVLKPMSFFTVLEEQGRLQIQTLALQIIKGVTALLLRANGVAVLCVTGICIGMLWNGWRKSKEMLEVKREE